MNSICALCAIAPNDRPTDRPTEITLSMNSDAKVRLFFECAIGYMKISTFWITFRPKGQFFVFFLPFDNKKRPKGQNPGSRVAERRIFKDF